MTGGTSSRAVTRGAFIVIVLFVIAQVTWWLIFQERYLSGVTEERLTAWRTDASVANELYGALSVAGPAEEIEGEILNRYPHLRFREGTFEVDPAQLEEFLGRQRGYMRMFAFEGPFFALVVMAALLLIGRSLRAERDLKKRQQNFLSAVTHEFNTPISTLRLLIETAQLRPLPAEKSQEYLKRMEAEVTRLEQASGQVLASARLEEAKEPVPLEAHDLNALTERVLAGLEPGLVARGATLEFIRARQPVPVSVEEGAFALIVGNLVDNAIKYSPGQDKPVTVRIERNGDLARLHVEDRGSGLKKGEEGKIFERFYRSGDELTRETAGMGLGLHLVKSSVEAMNGWMRAQNRSDGPGARFTVVLPLRVGGESSSARGDDARSGDSPGGNVKPGRA